MFLLFLWTETKKYDSYLDACAPTICVQAVWYDHRHDKLACSDMFETFPPQVAQYIKFEIPVLDSFVEKLKEEEEREINKLTKK